MDTEADAHRKVLERMAEARKARARRRRLISATVIVVLAVMATATISLLAYGFGAHNCNDRGGTWEGDFPFDRTCTGGAPDGALCRNGLAFTDGFFSVGDRVPEWDHYCEPTP